MHAAAGKLSVITLYSISSGSGIRTYCQIKTWNTEHKRLKETITPEIKLHSFMLVIPNQTRQCFSNFFSLLLSNFGASVNCSISFLLLADRTDTQCGLLQGLMCCVQRNSSAYLVSTSGHLSYCFLTVKFKLSDYSPLTSGINKAFSPRELALTAYICFFFQNLQCKLQK